MQQLCANYLYDTPFLTGLGHGFMAITSGILTIFYDHRKYVPCETQYWHLAGFLVGLSVNICIILKSLEAPVWFLGLLLFSLLYFILESTVVIGTSISIGILLVYCLYWRYKTRARYLLHSRTD